MKYLRVIPSLLLSQNKLVKGVKFSNHKIAGSPETTITSLESQGADEIILIDIDSYRNKDHKIDLNYLKEITNNCQTPITYGGGIDTVKKGVDVIKSGFEKIYLNRILLKNPKILREFSNNLGSQAIVAGINLTKKDERYKIYEDKNNKYELIDYINLIQEMGIGEIKITFVDYEGTKKGFDINFLKKLSEYIKVSSIYEGGIGSLDHLNDAFSNGASAIALGTMITFKDYNIIKIKKFLKNQGYKIRV